MKTKEEKQNDSLVEKYLAMICLTDSDEDSLKDILYLIVKDSRGLGFIDGFKQCAKELDVVIKEYAKKRI